MNLTATVRSSNIKKVLLLTALAACSEAPTQTRPVVQQGTPVTPSAPVNAYKPTVNSKLLYNQPLVDGSFVAEDKDAKGVSLSCIYTKPDGTTQLIEGTVSDGSVLSKGIQVSDEAGDAVKIHRAACRSFSQGDTSATVLDSLVIAAKPKPPVPPSPTAFTPALNPQATGFNNKTYAQNFEDLVSIIAKPEKHYLELKTINGKQFLFVPWYSTSSNTNESSLHSWSGVTATREKYFMVTDELREVAINLAMSSNCSYMEPLRNTIQALKGNTGLPGWISEVNTTGVRLLSQDPATDGTNGLSLALHIAAKNPACSPSDRAASKALGDELARTHLAKEYIQATNVTGFSGKPLGYVLAGGAGTASAGFGNAEMWSGYFEVNIPALIAAYASTGDTQFLARAESNIEQFLVASGYNPSNPTQATVPRKQYKLGVTNNKLTIIPISSEVFDDSDAPRALWMGNALRVAKITGIDVTQGVYKDLASWTNALLSNGTQTAMSSCIQYTALDASKATNCGSGQYQNGLGGGLVLYAKPEWVQTKLSEAAKSVDWSTGNYWSGDQGVFRNRLPKFLGVAIGRDAAAYIR